MTGDIPPACGGKEGGILCHPFDRCNGLAYRCWRLALLVQVRYVFRYHILAIITVNQRFTASEVVPLTCCQHKTEWMTQALNSEVNFG